MKHSSGSRFGRLHRIGLVAGGAALLVTAGSGASFALASYTGVSANGSILSCMSTTDYSLRIVDHGPCPTGETLLSWNQKGPRGATGDVGAKGDPGAAGAKGDTGATGSAGPAGPVGPKGDNGAAGGTGPKGNAGDPGAPGGQGIQGPKGDTAPGTPGAPGAPGADGAPGTAPAVYWAVVTPDATLVHGSHAYSASKFTCCPGSYQVSFDKDISTCAAVVTTGVLAEEQAGTYTARAVTTTIGQTSLNSSTQVGVNITTPANAGVDSGFSLAVYC
jgi:hypothetical protein